MVLHLLRFGQYGLGLAMLVFSAQDQALASLVAPVPEIDGASISAGLGLLAGGYLILRSRRWK